MKRVLIVDDDPQIRFFLRTVLEAEGYACDEAESGMTAIARFDPELHSAVILDIIMPDMEGVETLKALRKQGPSVGIIAVSGGGKIGGETYLKMIQAFGVDYAFPKPLDTDKLLSALHDLTGNT